MSNFALIIGTDSKAGVSLSERADAVHQQEVTVQARRGTIYDRTGIPIAEDSTTYTIYAIIDTDYVSEFKEVLYVEATQFSKVAEILNKYLGMETDYVNQQLNQPELKQVYFGTLGKNISYSTMSSIQEEMKTAGIKGLPLMPVQDECIQMEILLQFSWGWLTRLKTRMVVIVYRV